MLSYVSDEDLICYIGRVNAELMQELHAEVIWHRRHISQHAKWLC